LKIHGPSGMTVSLPRKFASFGAIFVILLPKVAEAGRESLLAKDDSVHVLAERVRRPGFANCLVFAGVNVSVGQS
jgi:hypothetical protein